MNLFTFEWLTGTANDHFAQYCIDHGMAYHYDHYGRLCADLYGVGILFRFDYRHISEKTFQAVAIEA